ncbi:MAG: AmmeMemoRadiSam system protein B [Candidatus Sumerlaeota bacterium]|nr:AmmeMemoRadiSam system protein B [Candidatus Sumerlaeota bacterium]
MPLDAPRRAHDIIARLHTPPFKSQKYHGGEKRSQAITVPIEYPRIRSVEIVAAQSQQGDPLYLLRDPQGLSDVMLTVPPLVGWLLQFFDGAHTRKEIQAEFRDQLSAELQDAQLENIIQSLERAAFLEGERYEQLKSAWLALPTRVPAHAGAAYPSDSFEINAALEGFYRHSKGPGLLPSLTGDGAPIKALVAPHIDLKAGGPCFAHAYHALARAPKPDLFVILGTGHAGLEHLFAATRKDFETPLGMMKTDVDFIGRLAARYGPELFAGELLHKREHVIEFQTIFLRHLYGNTDLRIAPILCSFSYPQLDAEFMPEHAALIRRFCAALRQTIQETPGRVCLIASVDLAHIGPQYGDAEAVAEARLKENEQADRAMLELLSANDVQGFDAFIRAESDARHVCGFPCLHTLLETLGDGAKGQVLSYDCTTVDNNASYVSYVSMAFR